MAVQTAQTTVPMRRASRGVVRVTAARASVAKTVTPSRVASRGVGRKRGDRAVVAGLFGLGLPELVVIGGVAAVLFGPQKLPELGKSLGKTVKSFQEAAKVRTRAKTRGLAS